MLMHAAVVSYGPNWYLGYNGYGTVSASARDTKFVLEPRTSTTPSQTHAAVVLSTKTYRNLNYTVKLTTNRQLRRNSRANSWEVGWFLWDYTDDNHFYYLLLKPNGWELGQENPHYAGDQRYLLTKSTPTYRIGHQYTVRIVQSGATIKAYVDGKLLLTYTDTKHPYYSGHIGLYDEDSVTEFVVP
jgi:hypothetical protein